MTDVVVALCLGEEHADVEADLRVVQRFTPRARIVRVAGAAEGLALSDTAHVALVAAGTQVGPGWLERLLWVAHTNPGAGSVSALSTADTQAWGIGPWPQHLTWPEVARGIAIAELPWSVPVTAPRGPCVLMTQKQIRSGGSTGPDILSPRIFVGLESAMRGHGVLGAMEPTLPDAIREQVIPELERVRAKLAAVSAVPPRRLYVVSSCNPETPQGWRRPLHQQAYECASHDLVGIAPGSLLEAGIELIHAEHLAGVGTLELAALARTVGAGLVVDATALGLPRALPGVDAVVVRDEDIAKKWREELAGTDCVVATVDPGSDLARHAPLRDARVRKPGPIRALLANPIDSIASKVALGVLIYETGTAVEWHVVETDAGSAESRSVRTLAWHRRVPAVLRQAVLAEIDPDVWAIPQGMVFDPALQERQAHALGVPVITGHPAHAGAEIARLAASPTALRAKRRKVPWNLVAPAAAAAERRRELYEAVEGRRGLVRHRIGFVTLGEPGNFGGVQQIRVLRPLANQAADSQFSVRQVSIPEILNGALRQMDTLLIQRQVLRGHTEDVIAAVRAAGVRLVVELDDDLLHPEAAGRMGLGAHAHAEVRRGMITLLRGADAVTVSTQQLQSVVAAYTRATCVVVPNALDPRLWLRGNRPFPASSESPTRILYMGTKTHREDLMLLRDVVPELQHALGRPVILDVVGVSDRFDGDGWFERLVVPTDATQYPAFVAWLRARRLRWSIAVAPLADTEFNSAKSDLKLLEYGALGLPVVASRAGPYRHSDNLASLTGDESAEWVAALTACLRQPNNAECSTASLHIRTHRMLTSRGVEAWLRTIAGLAR